MTRKNFFEFKINKQRIIFTMEEIIYMKKKQKFHLIFLYVLQLNMYSIFFLVKFTLFLNYL